jgi:hypothetical protein
LDEGLAEIYGMYAFEYDGNYIGISHIYRGFGSGLQTKYSSGIIDTQLRLREGYGHEDYIAFSGDSTDWVPRYKIGRRISDLVGKTLVFEIKFENG